MHTVAIERMFAHPGFSTTNGDYDAGVIRTAKPMVGQFVAPIPFKKSHVPAGTQVVISGWGNSKVCGT